MNPETSITDNHRQRDKIDMRQRGIFFMLGGLVFLLQGVFDLKDTVTRFLIAALVVVYIALSQQQPEKNHIPWIKRVLQLAGWFVVFIMVAFAIFLGWGWIWKNTGIPVPYLAAFTSGILGLGLIVLSYKKVSIKPRP
jgi:hypothetical protein